jgi:succinoglycan biosynthesis transport protein ExoP
VANAIAQSYLEHSYSLKLQSSASLSRYVDRQLQELKAKMDQSSLALARYERELNLVNPQEKTSLVSMRLLQLNTEYTQAQSERFKREAAFNMAKSDNLDVAQASSISESLRKLVERRDEAREKFSQTKEHYGVDHPEFRRQSAQMIELDRQVDASRQSIAKRLEALYKEAIDREAMVIESLRGAKGESDRLNAKSFDYDGLKREAESDKKLYEQLGQRVKEATVNASFRSGSIRIADPARPPQIPVSPNLRLNLAAGFLLCFVIGASAAIARESLDGSVRNHGQARCAFNVGVLGSLPMAKITKKKIVGKHQTLLLNAATEKETDPLALVQRNVFNVYGEAIRSLHNSMMLQGGVTRMRTILVTSAVAGEGKSTTAAHLAMVNALKGRKTLLIDADLRRPSLHRIFDMPNSTGLADFLTEDPAWRPAVGKHPVVKELDVLTAGPATSSSLELVGDRICALLEQAAQEYDLVIVDSPPLLGCSETLPISTAVDGVLLVVAAGATNRRMVQTTLGTLSSARANVLGLTLNRVAPSACELLQYSNYNAYAAASRG